MPARTAAIALAILAFGASPAYADFTVSNFKSAPANTQAGAHSDYTVSFDLGGSETIKDLDLNLPPGLVGNPNAATKCAVSDFNSNACAPSSQVGSTSVQATANGIQTTASGEVFNLVPNAGEPARLGIHLSALGGLGGEFHLQSPVTIRTSSDFGLTSTLRDMPNQATILGIPTSVHIDSVSLTLNGNAANGPFTMNPTSCAQATTTLHAVGYGGTPADAQASFTPTGCDSEPFAPKLNATVGGPGQTAVHGNPQLVSVISQQPGEAATSSASVTLPAALGPNLGELQHICLASDFAGGHCPAASTVGSAEVISPLLPGSLTGPVQLVENPGQSLPRLVLSLTGLISFQLTGQISLGSNGTTTTFAGIPDVPLSSFRLTLNSGANGLIANTKDLCAGGVALAAHFVAHSGKALDVTAPATIQGCTGALAGSGAPLVSASLRGVRRGRPTLRLALKRAAGGAQLRGATVTLPKQLRLLHPRFPGGGISTRGKHTLTIKRIASEKFVLVLRRGALRTSRKLRRARIKVRVTVATGQVFTLTKTVKAR